MNELTGKITVIQTFSAPRAEVESLKSIVKPFELIGNPAGQNQGLITPLAILISQRD